jgi:hypothetical protein
MVNDKRRFGAGPVYQDADILANKLTNHSWTLCTAFDFVTPDNRTILFLNDAFSEDGAQEYAVIAVDSWDDNGQVVGRQIESITMSWCTPEEARKYINDCAAPDFQAPISQPVTVRVDKWRKHESCRLCA